MMIVQVVASIEKQADGVTQTVSGLCRQLAKQEMPVRLHALAPAVNGGDHGLRDGRASGGKLDRRHWGFRPLRRALKSGGVAAADICHTHGIWLMSNICPACAPRNELPPHRFSARHVGTVGAASVARPQGACVAAGGARGEGKRSVFTPPLVLSTIRFAAWASGSPWQ